MNPADRIREARHRAKLTQSELARRARTSQAAVSAYESGAKRPSVATLDRLLKQTGYELRVTRRETGGVSSAELKRRGKILAEVLAFAETLPARRRGPLRYPRLETLRSGEGTSPRT
ncbi:MAG: helix-turn-helix domain-containing protein [Solirubrobacterales bacterium]